MSKVTFKRDTGKKDITFGKLIFYQLLFYLPLATAVVGAMKISQYLTSFFQTNTYVLTNLLMVMFSMIIFFFLIPYIRKRENIRGVRHALFGFIVVGFSLTIPAVIKGNYGLLLSSLIPIGNYILLTFIYCPEVLGMDVDIGTWFEQYKQLMILVVYVSMISLYILGFAWMYFQMAIDPTYGAAFNTPDETAQYSSYVYYSVVIFGTIGFGEITPVTKAARFTSALEALMALIINVIFIAILFVYVSNFRDFLKKEERQIKAAQKEIRKIERRTGMLPKKKAKKKSRRKRR